VYIEGRLQTREFVVDDQKRKQIVIVAEEVKFIDREKLPERQHVEDEEPAL
jgi:single-stranded DNA-binding protein